MKDKSFYGKPVPVVITVYKDKKFDFIIKSPPASHFIREAAKLKSGSSEPESCWIDNYETSWVTVKK